MGSTRADPQPPPGIQALPDAQHRHGPLGELHWNMPPIRELLDRSVILRPRRSARSLPLCCPGHVGALVGCGELSQHCLATIPRVPASDLPIARLLRELATQTRHPSFGARTDAVPPRALDEVRIEDHQHRKGPSTAREVLGHGIGIRIARENPEVEVRCALRQGGVNANATRGSAGGANFTELAGSRALAATWQAKHAAVAAGTIRPAMAVVAFAGS